MRSRALGACRSREGPDLIAVSGHKIHGPKGVGGLWMRAGAEPEPLLHGGGQEQGLRSGTLSPALCVGLGEAAHLAAERQRGRCWSMLRNCLKLRSQRSGKAG